MPANCISSFNHLASVERETGDPTCDRGRGKVLDVVSSGLNPETLGIHPHNASTSEILECNEPSLRHVDETLIPQIFAELGQQRGVCSSHLVYRGDC